MIIQSAITDSITHKLIDARLASSGLVKNMVNSGHGLIADAEVPAAKAVSQRIVQVCCLQFLVDTFFLRFGSVKLLG